MIIDSNWFANLFKILTVIAILSLYLLVLYLTALELEPELKGSQMVSLVLIFLHAGKAVTNEKC